MMAVGSSSAASCYTSVIGLLQRVPPVEIVRVSLSKRDGIVVDSKQWQVSNREPAELAGEIVQYIRGCGSAVEATIVGWSDH